MMCFIDIHAELRKSAQLLEALIVDQHRIIENIAVIIVLIITVHGGQQRATLKQQIGRLFGFVLLFQNDLLIVGDDNIELAIVDSMKCCSRILKEMELDIGVQYTCIFRRHHLCLIKGHDLMERVKHRLIRSEYKCVLAVTLILRVLLCKQELIEDASSNQDSLAESHSQSVDIVRIVLLKLLHLLEDSFILIVAQVDKAELSVLMDTIIGGVREPVAAVPPIIEDLIHMSIIKKLLDKYIHFQRVELRLTEESIGIFALIVICEELSCQVIVTGAYLTTVLYIESP